MLLQRLVMQMIDAVDNGKLVQLLVSLWILQCFAVDFGMGLVFGKINVGTPKYIVLRDRQDYKIPEYGSNLIVEVSYDSSESRGGNDGGFFILAEYISVLGEACNVKVYGQGEMETIEGEKIAMTALVITQETGRSADLEKDCHDSSSVNQRKRKHSS